ncbi:hypothetical protein [Flavobacterium geliluteum]|uniref:DoxX family protein n=1 Tax=Flavobacterium geliluteum TaxID=2816120 RepID=A0A940XCG5_9FLAO|nr:hypothetical protein [Flavobacterium geliluteum]MBP4139446.1 hypothetical protein [Flavobacterium geliluteum]
MFECIHQNDPYLINIQFCSTINLNKNTMLEQSVLQVPNSIGKKISVSLIFCLEVSALLLLLGNGGNIKWMPPILVFSLIGVSLVSALFFPFVWHYLDRKQKIDSAKVYGFLYSAIRYCIAFNMAAFGWKKFYGLQFIVPTGISNMPMNQQSGEWLTWFYFGYSHGFGIIIAVMQIVGGYLLLSRKTLIIGALILFSLLLNLTLINIFYQMNAGALMQSILLLIGVTFLIILEHKKWIEFFLKTKSSLPTLSSKSPIVKNVLRSSAVILSLLFTMYLKSLMK